MPACGNCYGSGKVIFMGAIEVDCDSCRGTGLVGEPNTCPDCKGSGTVIVGGSRGALGIEDTCDTCKGTGKVGLPDVCPACNGSKTEIANAADLQVEIACTVCAGSGKAPHARKNRGVVI